MMMKSICLILVCAVSTIPAAVFAQGAGAPYVDDRLGQINRSISDLQSRAAQLQKQNQQLQLQLDKMRSSYESRLERLEKGGAPKAPPPRTGKP